MACWWCLKYALWPFQWFSVCGKKWLEGMHTILFDGHRSSRHRAKVKPGEKPVVMAMLNTQVFVCCLTAWIFSDKACGQSQAFSGAVSVVEVNVSSLARNYIK